MTTPPDVIVCFGNSSLVYISKAYMAPAEKILKDLTDKRAK